MFQALAETGAVPLIEGRMAQDIKNLNVIYFGHFLPGQMQGIFGTLLCGQLE